MADSAESEDQGSHHDAQVPDDTRSMPLVVDGPCKRTASEASLDVQTRSSVPIPQHVARRRLLRYQYETPVVLAQCARQLMAAVDGLPEQDKMAYQQAVETAPHLVERDVVAMLRCEDFNAVASAKRLVRFWTLRQALFQERYCLPLDLTGTGAMNVQDIAELQTGFLRFLPSNTNTGRLVLLDDMTLDDDDVHRSCRDRCRMYMYSTAASASTSKGLDVLHVSQSLSLPLLERADKMAQVVPVEIVHQYYFFLLQEEARGQFAMTRSRSRVAHRASHCQRVGSVDELGRSLMAIGISPQSLPKSLGGAVHDDEFQCWLKARQKLDGTSRHALEQELVHREARLVAEERAARRAQRLARKMERARQTHLMERHCHRLHEQLAALSDIHAQLYKENKYLHACVREASQLIQIRSQSQRDTARLMEEALAQALGTVSLPLAGTDAANVTQNLRVLQLARQALAEAVQHEERGGPDASAGDRDQRLLEALGVGDLRLGQVGAPCLFKQEHLLILLLILTLSGNHQLGPPQGVERLWHLLSGTAPGSASPPSK